MRRCAARLSFWNKYYFPPSGMPKSGGPAPKGAPQAFNDTKAIPFIDNVEDSFPTTIRGNKVMPDIPLEENFYKPYYMLEYAPMDDFKDSMPWSSTAKDGAFRFRQWPEFGGRGASAMAALAAQRHAALYGGAVVRDGKALGLHKESYLTAVGAGARPARVPRASATLFTRAIRKHFVGLPTPTPLEQQRDMGRIEEPNRAAHAVPVSNMFPFRWSTKDWYNYEVGAVRQRRFFIENDDARGGEVTYKLVIQSVWDHHAKEYAADLHRFFNDLGRQVVEQKLVATRESLATLSPKTLPPLVLEAARAEGYDEDEAVAFAAAELRALEEQCVRLLALANAGVQADIYDPSATWPHVEHLEAWKRMWEHWSKRGDETFAWAEASTRKYEFERFFRVVVVKLPFHSAHFERRVFDTIHWAHRRCGVEIQVVNRKNVVHDGSLYPLEHSPAAPLLPEEFGPLSFALDWEESPPHFTAQAAVQEGDTWELLAQRLGCTVAELRAHNDLAPTAKLPAVGATMLVPKTATKRLVSFHAGTVTVDVKGDAAPKTWEELAEKLGCTVGELKSLNAEAASEVAPPAKLRVPSHLTENTEASEFSPVEPVYASDTFTSVAERLGCTVEALKAANPSVGHKVAEVHEVLVPPTATHRRRVVHPLRDRGSSLFQRTIVERAAESLPSAFPTAPPNAARFPMEYDTRPEAMPKTPAMAAATADWLSYTAAHLDPQLSVAAAPAPRYSTNPAWPVEVLPGAAEQTPFEEDNAWQFNEIPLQQKEVQHTAKYLQDLPEVNHELLAQSLEWKAP